MTPRGRLVFKLGIAAALLTGASAVIDLTSHFPLASISEFFAVASFFLAAWFARKGKEDLAAFLILAMGQTQVFLFDDGFGGNVHSWFLHITLWVIAMAVHPPEKSARIWGWIGVSAVSLALVNLTPFTPRWNALVSPDHDPALPILTFLMGGAATLACLRMMQTASQDLLEESRKLSDDLKAALVQAESASHAKTDFLSHMTHELRTPLNAISGFAQILLQDHSTSPETAENVQAIRISAEHLVHLVGDVLDLSRMEHGNLVLSRVPFQPREQLAMVHSILTQAAREKGLAFETDSVVDPAWIEGDPVRWRQVLLNLASNAIKYTPAGKISIRLEWTALEGEAGWMQAVVSDTGPGIPPGMQERIFRKFERLPEHETGPVAGAGLGLSIARDLAEAMDGELSLDSRPGEGASFRFRFRTRRVDAPAPPASDAWTRPWNPQGVKVLLCEDNRLNIRLATQVLQRLGVEHDIAMDGLEALRQLGSQRYDAVLLDLHMPRCGGFEVAQILRASDPPHPSRDVPILALTADASEETLRRTRESGMDDFLAKPFHLPELEERLRRLVRRPPQGTRA